jgi:hypothetical protein
MSNTLLTISQITREALMVLENELPFTKSINREYDDKFAQTGAKIGATINVRKPPRYLGRSGEAIQVEDSVETYVPVTLSNLDGCDIQFTTTDLTLSIDDFSERFIKPAIATVANKIEYNGLQLYKQVYNALGTPGTQPTDLNLWRQGKALLADNACPMNSQLTTVINQWTEASLTQGQASLFNPQQNISEQYETGVMGTGAGFKFKMGQNVANHTFGQLGGTPLVNTPSTVAKDGDTTIVTDGWTASAATRVKAGDIFTIANVYAVNPQSRKSTGKLQKFVATADGVSDGSGNMTISFSPALQSTGQFQNIDSLPADNAALTFLSAASQVSPANLAFHRDAFCLVTADLMLPNGVDMAARVSSKKTGLSVRMVRQYDIRTNQMPCRLDVLYGFAALRPELAVRIHG